MRYRVKPQLISPTWHRSGSALLLTILTVSLLMVIVLALVVMVRLELRSVMNQQRLLQARAHARLGAELAIGLLQETAGPDTRVTAPHRLQGTAARPNLAHIGQVLDAAPHVMGATAGTLAPNPEYGKSLASFLSWNRATNFDPLAYWPFDATGNATAGHVRLVGPGSASASMDRNADGVPDPYVAAPSLPIQGSTTNTLGHYAFWIRDEGLKAQINLSDPIRLESGGAMDRREQAITAQRVASEFLLPNFNPSLAAHNTVAQRLLEGSQLDLTSFGTPGTRLSERLFHDITLISLGLPTNPKRGGLKRDLSAVMEEAVANGGRINDAGPQWQALREFQAERMLRWRAETVALPGSRPAEMPEHRWLALQAIAPRADQSVPYGRHPSQNNPPQHAPELAEKVFPPLTDLNVRWDPGGPSWRQFLTTATMRQRLANGQGELVAAQVSESEKNIMPVLARFALSIYFTMDWPRLRVHFLPMVVLWNPYNAPLRVPPDHSWKFTWAFEPQHYTGYGISFKFANPDWRSGAGIWSPTYRINHVQDANSARFSFQLLDAAGSPQVVLPPGEAVFFSLAEHVRVPINLSTERSGNSQDRWANLFNARVPTTFQVDLRQGLHGFGGYGFYIEVEDLNERLLNLIARGPRPIGTIGSTQTWNGWDSAGFPFQTFEDILAYPDRTEDYHGSDYPVRHARNRAPPGNLDIAINVNGFDPGEGWRIEDSAVVVTGREGTGDSKFRSRGIYLSAVPLSQPDTLPSANPWSVIPWPYMHVPQALHDARPSDIDNPSRVNLLPYYGGPPPGFDDSRPFDDTDPIFPNWGLVWGLRMPDTAFAYTQNAASGGSYTVGGNYGAPSRWLVDYNPTAPFQMQDPLGRTRSETHRSGYVNPASFIGGFTIDPDHFNFTQYNHPGTSNQYIGLSDDLPPAGSGGPSWRPRLVLYDVPRGPEDFASIAAFMHAAPHSTGHAWSYRSGSGIGNAAQRRWLAAGNAPTESNPASDIAPSSPVYAVGNSFAPLLVPRHKAHHAYYPAPMAPATSPESVPFASVNPPNSDTYPTGGNASISYYPGYDLSYVLNEVLWDDFFLTPNANRRLTWQNGLVLRDVRASASRVLLSGAFNVNSTSVAAWAAVLASMLDVELPNRDGHAEANAEERLPFPRFLEPLSEAFSSAEGDDFEHSRAYAGYRRLRPEEIWDPVQGTGLAVEIVRQIELRGPFLSLAEFVNRRLVDGGADIQGLGKSGALQAAITNAGLNDRLGQPGQSPLWISPNDFQGTWPGTSASAFTGMYVDNAVGTRTTASPGFLMQSDLLARIGGVLQARSDTFVIRSHGGLGANPDRPEARSWAEVTVQRVADFVDPINPATDDGEDLSPVNRRFGRRFEITGFRWLAEEDI